MDSPPPHATMADTGPAGPAAVPGPATATEPATIGGAGPTAAPATPAGSGPGIAHLASTARESSLLPARSSSPLPIAAGLALAAVAVAAVLLARRRRSAARHVELLETASLGPKRSLVVARMGDEVLLLGSSEGGITLLATRPAEARAGEPAPAGAARAAGILARLRRPAAPALTFDALLTESAEDVELRRKLAAGGAGEVR